MNAPAQLRQAGRMAETQAKLNDDTHQREQGAAALRLSEERLRLAIDGARLGTWHWDIRTGALEWSEACLAIFGIPPGTVMSYEKFLAALHPDDRARTDAAVRQALKDRSDFDIEYRAVWPDGSEHWITAKGRGYYDAGGEPARMEGVVLDITERKESERALRESEEFNRRIVASSLDCIKVLDLDGKLLSISEGGQQLLEIQDIRRYLGGCWISFWQEGDQPRVREAVDVARAGGTGRFQAFCPSEAGSPRWWDVIVTPISGADGQVRRLLAVSRDITERQRAEEQLAESQQRLKGIVESAMDAIITVDASERIVLFNAAAEKMFHCPAAEALGGRLDRFIPERFRAAHHGHVQGFGKSGETNRAMGHLGSVSGLRADGEEFPIEASISHIEVGGKMLFTVILRDITERQRAEAALKGIEWMLTKRPAAASMGTTERVGQAYGDVTLLNTERTILDAVGKDLLQSIVSDYMNLLETSSAVYEKNGDYAFGIFSSGWCQAMDMASFRGCGTTDNRKALSCGKWHCHESCWNEASRKSIETKGPTDIACAGGIRLHAVPIYAGDEIVGSINFGYGDPPKDPAKLAELAAKYGLTVEELQRNAAAYERRPPFIIELAKERLLGSARLIGEIVQRRRAEDTLQRLNATLEQRVQERTAELAAANRELEAFSYSVSHDLRAPLRALDGFARILAGEHRARLQPEALDCLDEIIDSARQMGALIDELLAFSRIGKQALQPRAVDAAGMVRECLKTLAPEQEGRAVEIAIGELGSCQADPALLRQVWMNLLSNALKYTRKRADARIEIGCREEDGARVWFIRDNGVGFDMKYADKLFGVFQRLHRAEDFEGTGIGLATVQRIIHRHGGRIWAQAARNEGATFSFALPRRTELPALPTTGGERRCPAAAPGGVGRRFLAAEGGGPGGQECPTYTPPYTPPACTPCTPPDKHQTSTTQP